MLAQLSSMIASMSKNDPYVLVEMDTLVGGIGVVWLDVHTAVTLAEAFGLYLHRLKKVVNEPRANALCVFPDQPGIKELLTGFEIAELPSDVTVTKEVF